MSDVSLDVYLFFDMLSDGGKVKMPLEKAPWGDKFGMLADKYGIEWMVNIAAAKE
jgi:PhnB protein